MRKKRVSEGFFPSLTKEFWKVSISRDKLRKQAMRSKSEILQKANRLLRNKVNKLNLELKRDILQIGPPLIRVILSVHGIVLTRL